MSVQPTISAELGSSGELPAHWKTVKFGDVCKVQGGFAFKSVEYQKQGVPLVRISNLVNGKVGFESDTVHLSETKLSLHRDFVLRKGDTLIAMSGATTGKMATFDLDTPALLNQRVGRFRILSESMCSPRFISLLVTQITKKVLKEAYGAAQPNISPTQIEQMEIPLPPLSDQQQLVTEIEKQFTRLEAGVAALRRVQANLKRYRAAVLKAACEGRLVPTEKWPITTIRDVTSIVTKGSSPNWQGFDYCDDGVVFVRSQNVGWGKLDLSEVAHLPAGFNEKEKKSVLKVGDVLLNIVGASIGRAAIATSDVAGGNVNQAVAVIRCQQEKILPQFLMIYLLSPATQTLIHSQAVDVARANFSLGDISKMPVPIPSLAEQTRIVAEVERRLSVVEELESVVTANLQRATRLRQSILQKAFTGELNL